MRKFATCLVAGVLAAGSVSAESWDMATPYPDFEFHTRNIRQFAEEVKELTGGELEITVHSAQSLIKHPEIKNAVRSGQVPIGEILLSRLSNENPVYELDTIPFLANSYEEAEKLWEAQEPVVTDLLAQQNLRILFNVPWPPQGLYAQKPIESAADLEGLRFRTYNTVLERMAQILGMVPTQTEATEMATAFLTGRVDAMMTSPTGGAKNKAWDWSSHFYDVQGWLPKNVIIVNEQAFQALDEKVREGLLQAAEQAEKRGWEMSQLDHREGVDLLVEGGMQGIEPSEKLIEDLQEVGQTMTDEWVANASPEGRQVIEEYRSLAGD
jgi:TRAP-type transport system periplasmic protein